MTDGAGAHRGRPGAGIAYARERPRGGTRSCRARPGLSTGGASGRGGGGPVRDDWMRPAWPCCFTAPLAAHVGPPRRCIALAVSPETVALLAAQPLPSPEGDRLPAAGGSR